MHTNMKTCIAVYKSMCDSHKPHIKIFSLHVVVIKSSLFFFKCECLYHVMFLFFLLELKWNYIFAEMLTEAKLNKFTLILLQKMLG